MCVLCIRFDYELDIIQIKDNLAKVIGEQITYLYWSNWSI